MNMPAKPTAGERPPAGKAAGPLSLQRLLVVVLIALAAVGFYQLWTARVERALLVAETQLIDSQIALKATLFAATAQLDLLRVGLEQALDDPAPRPLPSAHDWLLPVPGRDAFSGPTPLLSPGVPATHVTLGAPLPASGGERARELAAAATQAPLFAAVKNNLGNASWVYYYSLNRLLVVHPYEPGSISWSDALLARDTFVNASPARNPGRGYYWSNVYADSAGKGLMCSVVNPVYDRAGRFRGVVGFDFTVDSLIGYLTGEELAIGTPFIVNKNGQLLAHPTLVKSSDSRVSTLEDALPAPLRPAANRLLEIHPGGFAAIGDAYVTALDLGTAPWRVLFVVDKRRLGLSVLGDMRFELAGMGLLLLALFFFLRNVRLTEELARLAVTDPLTGLANRRRFMDALHGEIGRSRRSGRPFSLLMLDIDHFKHVNDTYGHNLGDKAIMALAETLAAGIREIDIAGRLGGEEFGVILADTGLAGALVAAERLRQAVAAVNIAAGDGAAFRITVSIGAAEQGGEGGSPEELMHRADTALYASKNSGRNRVTANNGQ
ncbi:diguanylate cyclase [Anaeroselena agilis]|uniref:Diguanylate cyclase n=1 Tax=Anaeroselena agilis TaxID=3063788 RepID=A0ABU3P3A1_9FIRM|nr:diguanylate cyclase [Selenomonadales bacterium 4137-cl]